MAENLTLLAAASVFITIRKRRKQRENRSGRLWCRKWLLERQSERGMQHFVFNELALSDVGGFQSFLRMSPSTYDDLLGLIEPLISRSDTNMREAISAHEKLVVTLRYLSTGMYNVIKSVFWLAGVRHFQQN